MTANLPAPDSPKRRLKRSDTATLSETATVVRSDDFRELDPRVQTIVNLRAARTPWRAIGQQVGMHHETCRRWYRLEMKSAAARLDDSIEEHRVELSQSIELVARTALRHMVAAGGVDAMAKAGNVALRALAQYAALFGLEAPQRVIVEDVRNLEDPDAVAAELRQLIDAVSRPVA